MDQQEIAQLRDELAKQFATVLDAALAKLELRFVRQVQEAVKTKADATVVAQHDERLKSLEESRAAREHLTNDLLEVERRVSQLEKFRYAWPSLALLGVVASFAVVIYYVFASHP